ncbi:hypothetical protein MMC13_007221 [Lambiella insularis]|nr:hypothetical protein [Lambiella insularis]
MALERDGDDAPMLVEARSTMEVDFAEVKKLEGSSIRVPITIITGYLGAGKTTLLNFILKEQHGKKIAVILNEFGDSADIEKSLTVNEDGQAVEEWLELANGCICCSVKQLILARDAGVNAIESLMERRGAFDYILLETSGLADPGNIAPLFWVDDGLGSSIYLDGIVTVVDVKNIVRNLNDNREGDMVPNHDVPQAHLAATTTAHLQISYADVIILNKSDTVSEKQMTKTRDIILGINSLAKLRSTEYSRLPQLEGTVLDLHAYDGVDFLDTSRNGHSYIDPSISTVCVTLPVLTSEAVEKLERWLRLVLWEFTLVLPNQTQIDLSELVSIHRLKGRILLDSGQVKMVQGVREVFEVTDLVDATGPSVASDSSTSKHGYGKLVFIGSGLSGHEWEASLLSFLEP